MEGWTALAAMAITGTSTALAQDQAADQAEASVLEEVIVTGTRQLMQDQISITRDSNVVAVGLSATDIGNLPALSIGEALETLTGVSSHRENGGATEVSIRGMGPYLSKTLINGREASNGSSDRSVNFSMFPSELMNKLVVYKSQDAQMVEGGVSGLISLSTLKPLDYGKRRFQFDVKGNYNPDQQNIKNAQSSDIGWRGTLSYVDAFEFRNGGEFGISLGYQRSDTNQPEQEIRGSSPTGSSIWACLNEPSITNTGFFRDSSGDCEDTNDGSGSNQGYNTDIDPDTGQAVDDGKAFAFAPSSRGYRQNDTKDERDALFAAFQWRPNDRWDVNLDMEWSNRVQTELRNDLNFANQDVLFEFLDILMGYVRKGARIIRLDAIAYLWKEIGTDCIHRPQTHAMVKLFRAVLDCVAPEAVIVTETPVWNNFAYHFGQHVFDGLVQGLSVSAALRNARLRHLREWNNPLGLVYTLYGNPAARIE